MGGGAGLGAWGWAGPEVVGWEVGLGLGWLGAWGLEHVGGAGRGLGWVIICTRQLNVLCC